MEGYELLMRLSSCCGYTAHRAGQRRVLRCPRVRSTTGRHTDHLAHRRTLVGYWQAEPGIEYRMGCRTVGEKAVSCWQVGAGCTETHGATIVLVKKS